MAVVNIFEMVDLAGKRNVKRAPFQAQQTMSGTSGKSAAFAGGTRFVTIQPDTDVFIKFGTSNVSATTATDYRVVAKTSEDFEVDPGTYMAWTT
jgi:hypothetical protein